MPSSFAKGMPLSVEPGSQRISREDDPELLFEAYLQTVGLEYGYEHEIDGRHPDFWIPSSDAPAVVCEVTEVQKDLPGRVGSFDAARPVRAKIKKKAKQGKGLGALRIPFVVVLRSRSWPLDQVTVPGAMFGRVGITMPFDPAKGAFEADEARPAFGRDAQLQPDQHPHVSAVAVLRLFNPTLRSAEAVPYDRLRDLREQPDVDLAAIFEATCQVFEELEADAMFEPDALEPRLVVYRNVHAVNPLPSELLAGPYDECWGGFDGLWVQTSLGVRHNVVP